MIPITRKELYLNKIVGNNDYETPEKPITIEEFFFAEILGEAVQAPEPLTRYQMYLAKIAGRNIEIPTPITRLEHFLARAAGMDISTPVPITKEEIYWSNYTAIVEFEFEGVPPLTYKAIEGTLKNYRIYGQTVDGESVGDRTGNLFDGEFLQGYWAYANGTFSPDTAIMFRWVCTPKIPCIGNMTYTFSFDNPSRWAGFVWFDINGDYISTNNRSGGFDNGGNFTATSPANAAFMGINIAGRDSTGQVYYDIYPSDVTDFMLVEGSTPLPYEPYGYRVPVTVNDITTNIYLAEPLKMVGSEAEYIDYGEQKQHVDADEEIEKQATTYMVSITPETDVSKIVFVTMSSVPDDCTILTAGLIFTLDEADANTLNSTNYADGVRGKASTANNYKYTWTKKYTEGETYYIRSYVKYQTADNEIKEVYGDVYKADINGFERVRKNQLDVTLPALPTLPGTNVLSVGTAVQPSKVYVKYKGERQ